MAEKKVTQLFSGPRATRRPPLQARTHAVVAGHPMAALAAQRILDRGGNAADAGVAAGLCIDVLLPDLVSLGGVAPIIYHEAATARTETISGVGRWPRAATIDAVTDQRTGDMARDLRCCVVPAAVDAWITALERYGSLTFGAVAADAIALCERGFPVYDVLHGGISLVPLWRIAPRQIASLIASDSRLTPPSGIPEPDRSPFHREVFAYLRQTRA